MQRSVAFVSSIRSSPIVFTHSKNWKSNVFSMSTSFWHPDNSMRRKSMKMADRYRRGSSISENLYSSFCESLKDNIYVAHFMNLSKVMRLCWVNAKFSEAVE